MTPISDLHFHLVDKAVIKKPKYFAGDDSFYCTKIVLDDNFTINIYSEMNADKPVILELEK